jgi:hypothetical protein
MSAVLFPRLGDCANPSSAALSRECRLVDGGLWPPQRDDLKPQPGDGLLGDLLNADPNTDSSPKSILTWVETGIHGTAHFVAVRAADGIVEVYDSLRVTRGTASKSTLKAAEKVAFHVTHSPWCQSIAAVWTIQDRSGGTAQQDKGSNDCAIFTVNNILRLAGLDSAPFTRPAFVDEAIRCIKTIVKPASKCDGTNGKTTQHAEAHRPPAPSGDVAEDRGKQTTQHGAPNVHADLSPPTRHEKEDARRNYASLAAEAAWFLVPLLLWTANHTSPAADVLPRVTWPLAEALYVVAATIAGSDRNQDARRAQTAVTTAAVAGSAVLTMLAAAIDWESSGTVVELTCLTMWAFIWALRHRKMLAAGASFDGVRNTVTAIRRFVPLTYLNGIHTPITRISRLERSGALGAALAALTFLLRTTRAALLTHRSADFVQATYTRGRTRFIRAAYIGAENHEAMRLDDYTPSFVVSELWEWSLTMLKNSSDSMCSLAGMIGNYGFAAALVVVALGSILQRLGHFDNTVMFLGATMRYVSQALKYILFVMAPAITIVVTAMSYCVAVYFHAMAHVVAEVGSKTLLGAPGTEHLRAAVFALAPDAAGAVGMGPPSWGATAKLVLPTLAKYLVKNVAAALVGPSGATAAAAILDAAGAAAVVA